MKKFKRITSLLLSLLMMITCLSACSNPDEEGEETSASTTTAATTAATTAPPATEPDPEPEVPAPEGHEGFENTLLSSWNFKGDTDADKLSDKASGGSSSDKMILASAGAEVTDGVLKLSDAEGGYASIAAPEGSDLYDLKGKTVVFKARIENGASPGTVAAIFSKKTAYDVYFQNASTDRSLTFRYRMGSYEMTQTSFTTPQLEWRVYAIAVSAVDADNKCTITVYRSTVAEPASWKDFEVLVENTVENATADFLAGNDSIYLGKRHDHLTAVRGLASEFNMIRVYGTELNQTDLAAIDTSMDIGTLKSELQSLISKAEAITRDGQSDYEWNLFVTALNSAKALNSDDKAVVFAMIDTLRSQISYVNITAVPNQIGDLKLISYNNDGLITPIYTGLHAYPGFYDLNGDGIMDYIVSGHSRSYGNVSGGGLYAALGTAKGSTMFGTTRWLASNMSAENPTYSKKLDGSSVFVDQNGVMYTKLTGAGFEDGQKFSGLTTKFKLYDVDGDGLSDAVYIKGSTTGENYYDENGVSTQVRTWGLQWIKNTGTEENPVFDTGARTVRNASAKAFTVSTGTGSQYNYAISICMADWDGDGDLDLIAGGWLDCFYYYENLGSKTNPVFDDTKAVLIETEDGPLKLDVCRYNAINYDWNGDGKEDLIIGSESGTSLYLEFTGNFNSTTGAPIFKDKGYFSQEAQYIGINVLSRPTACDFDGDGDVDFIVGDNCGLLWFYENLTGGTNPSWAAPVKLTDETGKVLMIHAGYNGSFQGSAEETWGYTVPSACDWDGDGDIDVLVNSVTGRVVWFENIGTATNPQLTQPKPIEVEWENGSLYPEWLWFTPEGKELVTQHRTTPLGIDLNGDGLCDLVSLDHEGYLAFFERYNDNGTLKLKQGKRVFLGSNGQPLQLNSGTVGQSGRIKFVLTDWDGDGKLDLIVGDSNFKLYRGTSVSDGKYAFASPVTLCSGTISGHHHGFTVVDWNNDGKPDIVSGTESGYFYYLENNSGT